MIPDIVNNANVWYFVNGEQLHAFGNQIAAITVARAEEAWKRQHDAMFDPMFDKSDIAGIFKVDARTIDNWIAKGIINPTKIVGVVRFDGEEIVRVKDFFKRKRNKQVSNH